ncbi:MAG TPA: hypothetical protein DHW02_24065 [Ktedonobacter sp.]|nr:hypothetical protein [Ktedonobacter sp.]
MLAIAVNMIYATWQKRGTRRQLTGGVVVCIACALLLFVAIAWYNTRFTVQPGMLSIVEVELALVYVVILGWFLPISTSVSFCLFAPMRAVTTSVEIPKQKRRTKVNPSSVLRPPRHQQGVLPPFAYDQDTPWCWLEYASGRLQGQRLALKRAIIRLGREEDNDVWIDDEQASRYHAELAWDKGDVYLTDCESMNGVLLDGKRIRGTALIESGAKIEVGTQRFLFIMAEHAPLAADSYDPLKNHIWHSSSEALTGKSSGVVLPRSPMPSTFSQTPVQSSHDTPLFPLYPPVEPGTPFYRTTSEETPPTSIQGISARTTGTPILPGFLSMPGITGTQKDGDTPYGTYPTHVPHMIDMPHTPGLLTLFSSPHHSLQRPVESQPTAPLSNLPLPAKTQASSGMLLFHSGDLANKTQLLDRPRLTIGRDETCDIVVRDGSTSRQHAQFVRQGDGDYVQDLSSQNGTFVNEVLLIKPHLLQTGDTIRIGNMYIDYVSLRQERITPLPPGTPQQAFLPPANGSLPFNLPSRSNQG